MGSHVSTSQRGERRNVAAYCTIDLIVGGKETDRSDSVIHHEAGNTMTNHGCNLCVAICYAPISRCTRTDFFYQLCIREEKNFRLVINFWVKLIELLPGKVMPGLELIEFANSTHERVIHNDIVLHALTRHVNRGTRISIHF